MSHTAKLKTYHVVVPWFASTTVTVQARSVKEAMDLAVSEAYPSVCHQCSDVVNLDGGIDMDHFDEDCVAEAIARKGVE